MIGSKGEVICSRCGKKVGRLRIKRRFKTEMFIIGFALMMITQFISELAVNIILFK